MNNIFDSAIRNVKEFFTEPAVDLGCTWPDQDAADPLFERVALVPGAAPAQSGNQDAVLAALARAAENYFLGNIAPLLRNVPNLRWQIKQIQICETAGNMAALKEINKLSPAILNTIAKAILCRLPCAHAMDLSQFYGLCIVPDQELVGRAIVVWASIGQEKAGLDFYFDDEITESLETVQTAGRSATEFSAAATGFHLRLTDDSGAHDISLNNFPAIIGNAPTADVLVQGQYVSAQHLVLNWDAVLRCVYLVDRSRHGTYLKNGRRLSDGERVNLLGEGCFKLTTQANAPRFEYWHGAAPGQGTALLPPDLVDALAGMPDAAKAANAAAAPVLTPLRASVPHVGAPSGATRWAAGAAQPTLLAPALTRKPLAWLQIRNLQKQIETVPVNSLPFSIGREFEGDGYPVNESYAKVSRTHLRLFEQRGSAFGVSNDSPQRPGQSNLTFGEKGAESHKFVWIPQLDSGGNSKSGWRVLGSRRVDAESVEVRLLAADSIQGSQS